MQIDLPYCDLSISQNVEELRLQLNDYLYRLREAIETAIDMELASQNVVTESVTRLELEQMSNQILADANAVVRASLVDIEARLKSELEEDIEREVSTKQDIITDLPSIRSGAAAGATALQTESDPTVPSWAKESQKPTYTAAEVGALPDTTKIPEKVSELENDTGFITEDNQFMAVYGTTTVAEIESALNAGKTIFCKYGGYQYQYAGVNATYHYFNCLFGGSTNRYVYVRLTNNTWGNSSATIQRTSNLKTSTSTAASSDTSYYSSMAVDKLFENFKIGLSMSVDYETGMLSYELTKGDN